VGWKVRLLNTYYPPTLITSPPTAPVLSGEINGAAFDMEWTASTSEFGTVEGYKLYKSVDGAAYSLLVTQAGLTYSDSAVSEGHSYNYYVVGYDTADQDSDPSNTVGFVDRVDIEIITESRPWTKPADLLSVEITVIGGGSGGRGGGGDSSSAPRSGGGGAGGGISVATFLDGDLPASVDVVIGAGGEGGEGANGAVSGSIGDVGGDTEFGIYLTASGGGSQVGLSGGNGGNGDTEDGGDGADGVPQGGAGTDADDGESTTLSPAGGGGGGVNNNIAAGTVYLSGAGGDAGATLGGAPGVGTNVHSGAGVGTNGGTGDSDPLGPGGGGGGGGCAATQVSSGSTAQGGHGGNGGLYGAGGGGGGAAKCNGSAAQSFGGDGGDGAQGVVILRYTYNP